MVCLDTDFLIAYLENDAAALRKLEQLQTAPACTTMVNAFELYKGVYRAKEKQREASKVKKLLDSLDLLTLNHESARTAGELDAKTRSSTIGESDILIASIAVANKQTLITRNTKHFERVPGLTIETW